jgi:HK97 family phage major capsid protein
LPNELIRFASPATEALLRADMTKTLSLQLDYDCLFGEGSDNIIMGLVNVPNTATVTPTASNLMSPQDVYKFASAIEANNGEMQGFILRPELYYQFVQARAGVYNGSGVVANGQYVFDQFRTLGQAFPKQLGGYPAVTTPQVSITRGSGTQTTVFGGQWDDFLIAMFASIEFAEATQGDTAFANDQTVVRAILTADAAPRHPGVFAICDAVSNTSLGA